MYSGLPVTRRSEPEASPIYRFFSHVFKKKKYVFIFKGEMFWEVFLGCESQFPFFCGKCFFIGELSHFKKNCQHVRQGNMQPSFCFTSHVLSPLHSLLWWLTWKRHLDYKSNVLINKKKKGKQNLKREQLFGKQALKSSVKLPLLFSSHCQWRGKKNVSFLVLIRTHVSTK